MALQRSHPGAGTISERWLLTRGAAQNDRLPGRLLIPDGRERLNITRVVLLVPDAAMRADRLVEVLDALDMPHKTQIVVAELANTSRSRGRRRYVDALVARVRQAYPTARAERLYASDWLAAVRPFVGRHDLLIAVAGQRLPDSAFARDSLSQALLHTLNLPILEIAGVFPVWHARLAGWIRRALFDLFPFIVVGAFFWLQSQISSQSQGGVATFAIVLTVMLEFAVIFIWSLFLD
jgi:hypothetical protein